MTDEEFRNEIRAFIAAELPRDMATRTLKGYHPHKPDVLYWTDRLNRRGWSVPHWPVDFGGPGWTITQRHIFDEECLLAGCPALSPQGVHLVGPIIYSRGTPEQKAHFLPKIRSGEHFWAQGFSEPDAGSDLGSLRTRAVRDGDAFIVNGQKIWTSEAHYSEWLFLLVRTATEVKPQAGISFLLVDLATPGITIRPIIGIEGGHVLNEVFLEDVRVPVANLVGEENRGWTYAKELLGAERTFSADVPRCKRLLARARALAADTPSRDERLIGDPHFRRRLAQLEIEVLAHEATLWRAVAEEDAGIASTVPASSTLKVRGSELVQRAGALSVEAAGDDALIGFPEAPFLLASPDGAPGGAQAPGVVADFLYRRAVTIYGGTNEIQRNIIAAQLLRK